MTNEQMQKTMEFILEQQAQFSSDMQLLRESQSELVKAHERGEERVTRLEGVVLRLANVVDGVAQAQARAVEAQAQTDKKLAETDDRLNALINTVERYISERRNGKNQT